MFCNTVGQNIRKQKTININVFNSSQYKNTGKNNAISNIYIILFIVWSIFDLLHGTSQNDVLVYIILTIKFIGLNLIVIYWYYRAVI